MGVFAEFERALIQDRVRAGLILVACGHVEGRGRRGRLVVFIFRGAASRPIR